MTPRAAGLLLALLLAAADPALAAAPAHPGKHSAVPSRFGAIAYHRPTKSWGVSYNLLRARDASVEALKQCGHQECEVVQKIRNSCAALADGPKAMAALPGATRAEAETKTLKRCNELNRGASCDVIAWACTR